MVEKTSKIARRPRAESDISDLDLTDKETCILCFGQIQYFAMGKCNHKNVCHKCVLRIRLLMEDNKCSICKTELDELIVSSDKNIIWDDVKDKRLLKDKEDPNIYYEDVKAKGSSMQLRSLQCLMYNCQSTQNFPSVESLRRHLESTH